MTENQGTYLEPRYQEAVDIAKKFKKVSGNLLCGNLNIGYNHACRLLEAMTENRVIERKMGRYGAEYHLIEPREYAACAD
jgi:DNA segregation ATPase FtsK/SpoIIIE-like protein